MRLWIQYTLYLFVLIGFSVSLAGSYEDFFDAVVKNQENAIRALLKRGFDPNTLAPNGETALILALREPALKSISALLESPLTNVELRTAKDESPLMLAALRGHFDVCNELIARNADVNKPGWTPLHYAATGGHTKIIQLLVDHNAYIDSASPNGSTPLMMAAGYGTVEAVKALLDAGADPLIKNGLNLSASDFARQVQREDVVAIIGAAAGGRRNNGVR
jgi:ankyrin repeat protein